MTYKKKWSKKRRDTHLRNYNRARYTKIHQILMDLNLLQQLSAFTTKKYASKDYFEYYNMRHFITSVLNKHV